MKKSLLLTALGMAAACGSYAQLSTNPDKFLGNITTRGQVNGTGYEYSSLWNQITPENESKWSSIEGTRDRFTWGGCDNAYNYAKANNFPFKFHTLVWGSQYPSWMDNLSTEEQYEEIVEWMDAVKEHYPDLEMIDVVNEAVVGHAPAPYKNALGGDGKTGYDWIIKAFEMAAERWPNAILIYNDYNTFQWQKTQFIDIVKTLRDSGAPIDAYGCQSHDLTDIDFTTFKNAMVEIQNALEIPMYSTEYDIGTTDDAKQKTQYMNQIKYMWEQDYVAGITLWGYIYGATWTTDGNSGIIRDKKDRPAMTWLREYMATDEAKTAKSPFPGMYKEASVYIKPQALTVVVDEEMKVNVTARMRTKTVEKIELYAGNTLISTMTEAPYEATFTPTTLGKVKFKAIAYTTDGNKYERVAEVKVASPRKPFKDVFAIPGTIEGEDFDMGADGIAFHDANDTQEGDGASYRPDCGLDIVKGNGGYAVGYTQEGEWMEYTVDVKEAGYYDIEIIASAGGDNATMSIDLSNDGDLTSLAPNIVIPNKGWNTYSTLTRRGVVKLSEGKQAIRVRVVRASTYAMNLDKMVFKHVNVNEALKVDLTATPSPATVNEDAEIEAEAEGAVKVNFYVNDVFAGSSDKAPFIYTFNTSTAAVYSIKAVAVDAEGNLSPVAEKILTVNKKRTPYKGVITLPGVIEVEDFDICGEGVSFHDSDAEDEGKSKYRSDNEGVDLVAITGGYALGYTHDDEWLEYTVNVKYAGEYSVEAVVSSGLDGSGFTLAVVKDGKVTNISNKITCPNTDGSWSKYVSVNANLTTPLEEGQQIIRLTITGAYVNIDKLKFISANGEGIEEVVVNEEAQYEVYNAMGMLMGKIEAAGMAQVRQNVGQLTGKKGIYIIKNVNTGKAMKMNR